MAELEGLGAKFDQPDVGGPDSSQSGGQSSPLAASRSSSNTSLSLSSHASLPAALTHDTAKAQYHMKHLESFIGDLQLSVQRAFPNSSHSRYKEVNVLLLRWVEDELEVEWELEELRTVLRDSYGFTTDVYLIPTQNAHRKLMSKVLAFVEDHEEEDTLLIVYYGGHGIINKARQSTWSCKRDTSYASVEWSAVQTLFEQSNCDVLFLLDCCAGASAAPQLGRSNNMMETIAACGFETWAPRPGAQSFTTTLVDVLQDWVNGPPFSAAMLHSEILTRLKHEQPQRTAKGERVESRRTPTYIVSTTDANATSITLGKLVVAEADSDSRSIPGTFPTTLAERVQKDRLVSGEERLETLMALDENGQRKAPHVLLTVALEEDQVLDVASCTRWLRNFPLLAKHVSIEGVYRSYSTLLILSVPVVLWNLLPDNLAINFIGYVRSKNLAPTLVEEEQISSPIPIAGSHPRIKMPIRIDDELLVGTVSRTGSIDSGYASASVTGSTTTSPMPSVTSAWQRIHAGRGRGPLPYQVLTIKKHSRMHVTELLGEGRSPQTVPEDVDGSYQVSCLTGNGSKKLCVCVEKAELYDDKLGMTCVLWYGHEVERTEPIRRPTQTPEWNEEFRFNVHDSPMFYHLRLSVWGAQMLELIGETYIELRSLVQKGKVPELEEWHNLRRDGRTTGVIRVSLKYLDSPTEEPAKAAAHGTRDGRNEGHGIQGMDVRVW